MTQYRSLHKAATTDYDQCSLGFIDSRMISDSLIKLRNSTVFSQENGVNTTSNDTAEQESVYTRLLPISNRVDHHHQSCPTIGSSSITAHGISLDCAIAIPLNPKSDSKRSPNADKIPEFQVNHDFVSNAPSNPRGMSVSRPASPSLLSSTTSHQCSTKAFPDLAGISDCRPELPSESIGFCPHIGPPASTADPLCLSSRTRNADVSAPPSSTPHLTPPRSCTLPGATPSGREDSNPTPTPYLWETRRTVKSPPTRAGPRRGLKTFSPTILLPRPPLPPPAPPRQPSLALVDLPQCLPLTPRWGGHDCFPLSLPMPPLPPHTLSLSPPVSLPHSLQPLLLPLALRSASAFISPLSVLPFHPLALLPSPAGDPQGPLFLTGDDSATGASAVVHI